MVYDKHTKDLDFADDSLTPNMRCAYPLPYIGNASPTGTAGIPKNLVMLTCDAFGIMPPIARLTAAQAEYHFLSGFTAKVAGTEKGLKGAQTTFSTCFGAPFMTRRPEVYGALLREKIAQNDVTCWLVNTGWTGGGYGEGSRMPIRATRALLTAALNGSLNEGEFRTDDNFGFEVPLACEGVSEVLLTPRRTWEDAEAYDKQAAELVQMFADNFAQYEAHVGDAVKAAAPKAA
jgi:phosphoenolpyruvate carboxykinase (ATP)